MADKDYYDILSVSKNATKEEIKKSYKRLAKKYHPDVQTEGADHKEAEKKFKEINEAASVLGDDEKRSQYDQFGTSADQFGGGGFDPRNFDFGSTGGFDFGDIFDQLFSGGSPFGRRRRRGPAPGNDLRYDMEITLEEAAFGDTKHISIPKLEQCDECDGSGAKSPSDIVDCPDCNGQGMVRRQQRTPFGIFQTTSTCRKCKGEGKYIKDECRTCDGTGVVRKTKKLEISIPKGAEEGTNLRLSGEGEAGEKGAPSGDLYIVLHQKPHDTFDRRGDDIYIRVPIRFATATLGGEIEVPTLDGNAKLKIPAGTQNNTVFRMKGKGIPYLHDGGQGSQLVETIVAVPQKLSKKQKNLLQDFEAESKNKGFLKKVFK